MIVKAVAHHGKQLIAVGSMRDVDLAARWSMPTSAEVFLGNPEKLRSIDFCRWNINNNRIILLLTNQGQVSAQCMYHGLAHSEGRKMACLSSNAGKKENQKPFRTSSHPWGFGKQTFFWAVKWWQQSRKSCWVWVSLSRLLLSNLPEVDNFPFPFSLFFLLFIFFFLRQFCASDRSWHSLIWWHRNPLVQAGWFPAVDWIREAGKTHRTPETQLQAPATSGEVLLWVFGFLWGLPVRWHTSFLRIPVVLANPWSVTDTLRGASDAASTVTTFISVVFNLLCSLSDICPGGEVIPGRSRRHSEIHRNTR